MTYLVWPTYAYTYFVWNSRYIQVILLIAVLLNRVPTIDWYTIGRTLWTVNKGFLWTSCNNKWKHVYISVHFHLIIPLYDACDCLSGVKKSLRSYVRAYVHTSTFWEIFSGLKARTNTLSHFSIFFSLAILNQFGVNLL